MRDFLYEVANDLLKKFDTTHKLLVVFPNRRSQAYFNKHFANIKGKAAIAIPTTTINNFFARLSDFSIADKTDLIFDLFDIVKKIYDNNENKPYIISDIDTFYSTGETIISDFNDIDNYLINPYDIFANIKDLYEIDTKYHYLSENQRKAIKEFWNIYKTEDLSEERRRFLLLWDKMPIIYDEFKKHLISQQIGYQGFVNRSIVEKIENGKLDYNKYKHYAFVGFNALNKAERKIFAWFANRYKALFYWDTDKYYIDNQTQEAGFFMRENLKIFPNELNTHKQNNIVSEKNINILGLPAHISQTKIISEILDKISGNEKINIERTAIILADEHLLFPVIYAIPDYIRKVNITMGYPFKNTNLYALIDKYLNLQIYATKQSIENIKYYYKDVLTIIKHPSVKDVSSTKAEQLYEKIIQKNMIYVSINDILEQNDDFITSLFVNTNKNFSILFTNLLNILFTLFKNNEKHDKDEYKIENEYITHIYTEIKKLKSRLEERDKKEKISIELAIKLLRNILKSSNIPFEGKSTDGLQIMGVIETRNIDFDNIIVLGMNEGIFPDTKRTPSFIPDTLRIAFELPVIKYRDAIFAYFFYRLLQKSKNIYLTYNNITGDNAKGEPSRFILQLKYELQQEIKFIEFKQELSPIKNNSIIIDKDDNLMAILSDFLIKNNVIPKHKFSASAINTYIDCPVKFYFKYLVGINPPKQVEEEINSLTFGKILHTAIENLYLSYIKKTNKKTIDKSAFDYFETNKEYFIDKAFKDVFKEEGRNPEYIFENTNIIIKDVIRTYIDNILNYDKKISPFEIVDIEQKKGYSTIIDFQNDNTVSSVFVYGIFDRIDKISDTYRIIDYKTGRVNMKAKDIASIFDKETNDRNKTILQALLYSYIFAKKYPDKRFYPAIYDIRHINYQGFDPKIKISSGVIDEMNIKYALEEFQKEMQNTFSKIFNKDIPFFQTNDINLCTYCEYKEICNR